MADGASALVGVKLGGRFRLLEHVADGALGVLYEAADDAGARFAVKVMRRDAVSDDALSRFIRTASVMATAKAKRFVPVVDVGHDLERDLVFVVTPYLRSESLATIVARAGPLAPATALRLVLQAAEAVAEAHALDVVHRNVKPSNLFGDALEDGSIYVRLADHALGRAAVGEAAKLETSVSWRYLSPEQVAGSKASDRRTDVHGLGVTLYELLSGTTPWGDTKSSRELVSAISSGDPPAIQDRAPWVNAQVAAVVDRATRRDPERRFPSVEAFAKSLRGVIEGSERVTSEMLVSLDPASRSKVEPRVVGSGGDAFAPTLAGEDSDRVVDDLVGHRLGGRYAILRPLGHGGMGAVYEVEDATGARFAAKVILREIADRHVAVVARFLREGRAVTRIQDAHVTRTLELGTDMTLGVPFMIMELLTGRDLAIVLRERGAIATVPILRVFLQAARGLASAHAEGLVHRDVKPANIFLHAASDGEAITVKICDFGLAKSVEAALGEHSSHELTRSGGMLGTPSYMSPEHATNAKSVDARADVWSLSASLFEALTGRKLWGEPGSLGELIAAICSKVPPSLREVAPGIDPAIAAVVDRGLARDPNERWQSVGAMVAALEPLVGGSERVTLAELARVEPESLGVRDVGAQATEAPRVVAAARGPRAPETLVSSAGVSDAGTSQEAMSAAERAAVTVPPAGGGAVGRRRGRWVAGAAIGGVAIVIAGSAVVARRRASVAAPVASASASASASVSVSVGPPDFGSTMSTNAAATAAYRAAIQSWRDGAAQASRPKLEEATKLDPTFAAAHLRSVALAVEATPAVRAHAKSASQLRSDLSEHDRALLDAYLPWTEVPKDADGSERKLAALLKAHPEDADYAYDLCRMRSFTGDFAGAGDACDAALRDDPQLVDALRVKAFSLQARGDEVGAIEAYEGCFSATHMATACLSDLAQLQTVAGKCDDAVATARKWAALEPAASDPYRAIAIALQGSGQPIETVREVMTQGWDRMDGDDRAVDQAEVGAGLALLSGDFAGADARVAAWDRLIAKNDDEWSHLNVALWKVTLLIETGRNAEASNVATEFFRRRKAWTPTSRDLSIFLTAIQLRLGAIDDASWIATRDAWLANGRSEWMGITSRAVAWSYAYAYSVRDKKDAVEALAALPRFLPLTGGMLRVPDFDEVMARVYLVAGRPSEALPFAERASHTCDGVDYAVESTRGFSIAGHAYEALGDATKACASYAAVLQRWGGNPRSITANDARRARARLGCSAAAKPEIAADARGK